MVTALLKLQPLAEEGWFFVETCHSTEGLPPEALPARYHGPRSCGAAIYSVRV